MPNSAADWLLIGFIGSLLLAFLLITFCKVLKLKFPQYAFFTIIAIAMVSMLALLRLEKEDDERERRDLKQVDTAAVASVFLESAGQSRVITNLEQIRLLFSGMQSLDSFPAHHSHPIRMFDVSFRDGIGRSRYRIGQDSENAHEFWVFHIRGDGADDREIGRIQSTQLESMLQRLLANQP